MEHCYSFIGLLAGLIVLLKTVKQELKKKYINFSILMFIVSKGDSV